MPKATEHYTKLVIDDYHSKFLHSGVSQTSQTRKKYWIPHGRSQVKKVLSQCRVCCWTEGNPFKMPKMPPWPKERVNEALLFQYTGLDYFGPMYIKEFQQNNQLGQVTFAKLKVLVSPTLVADLTIDAIMEHLVAHYRLKTIKIAEHFKFFECSQKKKEKQQWTL